MDSWTLNLINCFVQITGQNIWTLDLEQYGPRTLELGPWTLDHISCDIRSDVRFDSSGELNFLQSIEGWEGVGDILILSIIGSGGD